MALSLQIECIVRSPSPSPKTRATTAPLKMRRMAPSAHSLERPTPTPTLQRDSKATCSVSIQGATFEVPRAFIRQMAPEKRPHSQSHGAGESRENPIYFQGPTIPQFRSLIHAFGLYPAIDINRLSLDQALSIWELAHVYGISSLISWSAQTMSLLFVATANSPLRTSSNEAFLRALRLAILYHLPEVCNAIQVKWMTRLVWRELSPIPAILFADKYNFRHLLGHAYYVYMTELGTRLNERGRFLKDTTSPLNRSQRVHILAGHLSLSNYWKHLRLTPPPIPEHPTCKLHKQCCAAWKMRWAAACSRPCRESVPEMDVLRRLRAIEEELKQDSILHSCLTPECRIGALGSIAQKRSDIANNLHHHFDLS